MAKIKGFISILMLTFIVFILTTSNSLAQEVKSTPELASVPDIKDRKEAFNKAVNAGKDIVKYLNQQDAKAIISELDKAHLSIFMTDRIFSVGTNETTINDLKLIMVMSADDLKGEFSALANIEFIALYDFESKSIAYDNRLKITDFWKGMIIACETLRHIEQKKEDFEEIKSLNRILKAQQEILSNFGKEKYQDILYRYATAIATDLVDSGESSSIIENMVPDTSRYKYPIKLDQIFGDTLSEQEIAIRYTVFWAHCYFTIIEECAKSSKASPGFESKLKDIFIRKLYTPPPKPKIIH